MSAELACAHQLWCRGRCTDCCGLAATVGCELSGVTSWRPGANFEPLLIESLTTRFPQLVRASCVCLQAHRSSPRLRLNKADFLRATQQKNILGPKIVPKIEKKMKLSHEKLARTNQKPTSYERKNQTLLRRSAFISMVHVFRANRIHRQT